MVKYFDSVEKLVHCFEVLSNEKLVLSNTFFRGFLCPKNCGACCPRFSLDYTEERWEKFKKIYPDKVKHFEEREVRGVLFHTDFQRENNKHFCKWLDLSEGRCKIHKVNPLSCEIEIIRFMKIRDTSYIFKRKFGRSWNMLNVEGKRGAKCQFTSLSKLQYYRSIELLQEMSLAGTSMGFNMNSLNKIINLITKEGYNG